MLICIGMRKQKFLKEKNTHALLIMYYISHISLYYTNNCIGLMTISALCLLGSLRDHPKNSNLSFSTDNKSFI